jgi:hypothetical protein
MNTLSMAVKTRDTAESGRLMSDLQIILIHRVRTFKRNGKIPVLIADSVIYKNRSRHKHTVCGIFNTKTPREEEVTETGKTAGGGGYWVGLLT